MNIAKNMEALFVIALALAGATTLAGAAVPAAHAAHAGRVATVGDSAAMPVVVVSARRLSAAEKAALPL